MVCKVEFPQAVNTAHPDFLRPVAIDVIRAWAQRRLVKLYVCYVVGQAPNRYRCSTHPDSKTFPGGGFKNWNLPAARSFCSKHLSDGLILPQSPTTRIDVLRSSAEDPFRQPVPNRSALRMPCRILNPAHPTILVHTAMECVFSDCLRGMLPIECVCSDCLRGMLPNESGAHLGPKDATSASPGGNQV